MMTKQQLVNALSAIPDETEIAAVFQGKYSIKYPANVYGVNIAFDEDGMKVALLVNEILKEEEKAA